MADILNFPPRLRTVTIEEGHDGDSYAYWRIRVDGEGVAGVWVGEGNGFDHPEGPCMSRDIAEYIAEAMRSYPGKVV